MLATTLLKQVSQQVSRHRASRQTLHPKGLFSHLPADSRSVGLAKDISPILSKAFFVGGDSFAFALHLPILVHEKSHTTCGSQLSPFILMKSDIHGRRLPSC